MAENQLGVFGTTKSWRIESNALENGIREKSKELINNLLVTLGSYSDGKGVAVSNQGQKTFLLSHVTFPLNSRTRDSLWSPTSGLQMNLSPRRFMKYEIADENLKVSTLFNGQQTQPFSRACVDDSI
nr:hypothetical protein [Tanacetum cinerariifolium]